MINNIMRVRVISLILVNHYFSDQSPAYVVDVFIVIEDLQWDKMINIISDDDDGIQHMII